MSARESYQWALLRVVPRVERGEQVNVGAAIFCRRKHVLAVAVELDEPRLLALDPAIDLKALRAQLEGLTRVADGDPAAGRVAGMDQSDRFGFITAPSSTIVQPSPIHVGVCDGDPHDELDALMARYVRVPVA